MRMVLQRVSSASVSVNDEVISTIDHGLLVFLGVHQKDTETEANYLIKKILGLRLFEDSDSKMSLSLSDVRGEILLVSQFTLYGDCRKGRRPSFSAAAGGERAQVLFEYVFQELKASYPKVKKGHFGVHMDVSLVNDGPVTIVLASPFSGTA